MTGAVNSFPFKGKVGTGWPGAKGMGIVVRGELHDPIPMALGHAALALPLKGREPTCAIRARMRQPG